MPTPFGTIYSSNLTPDLETGIGTWSEEAFRRAMHEGVDREGRQLYPAFPYDHFTKATDEDIHALYAFLMSIPAIRNVIPANQLLFPFSRARTGSSEVLAGQVSAGDLDTAIVMMESASRPATPLIGRIIATLDVAIVQSRRRPLVREPIRLAGLAKHAWILNRTVAAIVLDWKTPWESATEVCTSWSTPTARRCNRAWSRPDADLVWYRLALRSKKIGRSSPAISAARGPGISSSSGKA